MFSLLPALRPPSRSLNQGPSKRNWGNLGQAKDPRKMPVEAQECLEAWALNVLFKEPWFQGLPGEPEDRRSPGRFLHLRHGQMEKPGSMELAVRACPRQFSGLIMPQTAS